MSFAYQAVNEYQDPSIDRWDRMLFASCETGSAMAESVLKRYQERYLRMESGKTIPYLEGINRRFSDGETCVRLEKDVNGCDVYLFQALYDPTDDRNVDQNYMALLIAARAFREWGANRVNAVLPYLAYARQDRSTRSNREPTTAKLLADLTKEAGIDRLITWHPHSNRIQGFYSNIPVTILDPLDFFTYIFRQYANQEEVVAVAPDAGASKLITHFGRILNLNCAIAAKYRPEPEKAVVSEIAGDLRGKRVAILLDDMISSGGTIYATAKRLTEKMNLEKLLLGISHNLCMESAYERLMELYEMGILKGMMTTNSIPQTPRYQALPFLRILDISSILANVIHCIHLNRPLHEWLINEGDLDMD
jgi:ribose-phosphate pyrophosphokinase